MARITPILLIAGSLLLGACGSAAPTEQLTEIQSQLAKGFSMTPEQSSQVGTLVEQGKKALEAGDAAAAGKAFSEALAVLKIAEDTAMFNKSE
ncbi:MAG: hypothetical protein LJE84_05650 [Gammaproteobacteria bacterium]|jgi:hypothetical protein|nr:hypothetical protein [Gammaproteobacteria bacterium]